MIQLIEKGDRYEISFKYDPILIHLVKQVPGRQYVPDGKFWTIPKDNLGRLFMNLKGTVYESSINIKSNESINKNESFDITAEIPDVDVSNIKFYCAEGNTPYKHQIDFMKFAINRQNLGITDGFICCDSMGMGKSSEAISLALYNREKYGYKHCLIICNVNSSKYNWVNEIETITNGQEHGYILGTRFTRKGSEKYNNGGAKKVFDIENLCMYGDIDKEVPYFIITNVEALRIKQDKRKYPFTDAIINHINSGQIGMVIIDEIHKNMSMTSQQGKQTLKIKQKTGKNAMWLPLTGTPIVKRPTDVFLPLRLIDGHDYDSYYMWCKQFCIYGGYGDHQIIGYKNIPKLKSMLQHNMIRRTKGDDLPPKIYIDEYVENTSYQTRIYNEISASLRKDAYKTLSIQNPQVKLLRLRQVNGSPELVDDTLPIDKEYIKKNAKYKRLFEILEDIHERGEKVVIFSNWVKSLRTLYTFVKQMYKVCCFTGTMEDYVREQHKRVFQTNPEYTILLGTIGAAGTTHTFTAANNVIFLDEPWNATEKEQAIDRCHRLGTSKPVNIYTLMSKDTVDERVHKLLYNKAAIANYIVDNQLDFTNNPELYYQLIAE